jgi:sporulation protein YlmC with PRC-barrel domain
MTIAVSELYGKKIISTEGQILGEVLGVMFNFEDGTVSHLLLIDPERLLKSTNPRADIQKHSIAYKRVKKVGETIIVGKE